MTTDAAALGTATPRTRSAATTLWLLAAGVAMMLVLQLVVGGLMPPIGLIQAVILAVPLGMIARRIRGGFVTAAVLIVLLLLWSAGPIVEDLSRPGRVPTFVWTAIAVPLLLATLVAAVIAAVAAHHGKPVEGSGTGRS